MTATTSTGTAGTGHRVGAVSAVAAVVAVLAVLVGAVAGPEHRRLGPQTTGDPALAERVRAAAGGHDGYRSLAVAEVTPTSVTTAGLGPADAGAPFEIGSVTKTFTAALFADAVTRGEVRPDDPLRRALPELAGTPAGAVTLASLAQHRSGLPGLGATAAAGALATTVNLNPYSSTTTPQLLDDARTAAVDPQQPPTYSNFGVALLGTALVRAAGADGYPQLVADRITGPLGMTTTTFAATDAQVPDTAVPGHRDNGRPAPRWAGEGYLPAGSSTFSTVEDLARWAAAQLTGVAPGTAALTPTAQDGPGTSIDWIWVTSDATGADGADGAPTSGTTAAPPGSAAWSPSTATAAGPSSCSATPPPGSNRSPAPCCSAHPRPTAARASSPGCWSRSRRCSRCSRCAARCGRGRCCRSPTAC